VASGTVSVPWVASALSGVGWCVLPRSCEGSEASWESTSSILVLAWLTFDVRLRDTSTLANPRCGTFPTPDSGASTFEFQLSGSSTPCNPAGTTLDCKTIKFGLAPVCHDDNVQQDKRPKRTSYTRNLTRLVNVVAKMGQHRFGEPVAETPRPYDAGGDAKATFSHATELEKPKTLLLVSDW
jgi:hypothetical protein